MSTREMALNYVNNMVNGMSELELLKFIQEQIGLDELPTPEILEGLAELDYMDKHPEEYKSYISVDAMFDEILGEDDGD